MKFGGAEKPFSMSTYMGDCSNERDEMRVMNEVIAEKTASACDWRVRRQTPDLFTACE